MRKGPLVTRSELRRRQAEEQAAMERNRQLIKRQSEEELREKEQKIDQFYRKELKKNKPVERTRVGERQRSSKMNAFLMKSIIIVTLLLIVVGLMVFFL